LSFALGFLDTAAAIETRVASEKMNGRAEQGLNCEYTESSHQMFLLNEIEIYSYVDRKEEQEERGAVIIIKSEHLCTL
jgi:hypothetical protein